MKTSSVQSSKPVQQGYSKTRPTAFLVADSPSQCSQINEYQLTQKGFELDDVERMLQHSDVFSNDKVIGRIIGKSRRTLQRQRNSKQKIHLDAHQSAVAWQYAKIMESAIEVFGNQTLAEQWLAQPCHYLDGETPLDIIDNAMGYQAVEVYLERVRYGVYQ